MFRYIDKLTKKISFKNSAGLVIQKKASVYLYAHNAKGFDNFLVLQESELKFKNIINHGGITSLTISGIKI